MLSSFREIPNSFFQGIQAFQRTVVELKLDQQLGDKWKGLSIISFEINEYDIAAQDVSGGGAFKLRKDEYFSGLLSLTYSIQEWWEVKMEYSYTINDSNFDNSDYSKNVVFLRTAFTL